MSKIYKFHHVIGDNIKKTYVFNDTVSKNTTNNNTTNIPIYDDDMIINIKHKLCSLFNNQSHHEIYLFCKTKDMLNQSVYYQILTQDDNIKLTTDIYKRFVSNVAINTDFLKKPNSIPTKQLSSFYKNNQLWNRPTNMVVPIGINAFHRRKYIFHHNPFMCDKKDEYMVDDMKKFVSTENKKLLFKYKPENNDIYFCFADELLEFLKKQDTIDSTVTEDYIIQLYFPSLYNQSVSSLSDIVSSKTKLKSSSTKEYNTVFKDYNKNIELLHKYAVDLNNALSYRIKSIYFTIHPTEPLQLPLEVIFKKLNSSPLLPLMKYNPGKELESIYRLYTNDYISNKGLKIPSLYVENNENSRKIKQISSNILYTNRIGFYLDLRYLPKNPIQQDMYCILLDNGDIQVKLSHDTTKGNYDIHQLQSTFHPIIQKHIIDIIKPFVQKKHIYHFESLQDNNVELNNIDVVYYTDYTDSLTFKNLKCTSSVFSVINKNKKKNTYDLTYKRVSFYQKMNDIQSFINTKLQEAISMEEIKQMVISNFSIDEEKAVKIMDDFLKEIRLATDAFENRKIKIEDNPGFNIHIETKNIDYENIKLQRLFEIKNINDITYLTNDIIKSYLVSLININQLEMPLPDCTKQFKEKQLDKIQEIYENPLELEDAKIDFTSDGDDDDDMFGLMSDFEESDNESPSKEAAVETKTASPTKTKTKTKTKTASPSPDNLSITISDDGEGEQEDSIDLDELSDELDISLSGGNKINKQAVDLTSIKLKGSKNWFTNRLRKRQPDIFVMSKEDEKNKNYAKYSKSCQWQYKKQPIILNDTELEKIKKADKTSNSKSYDGHIKYKGYNYICPRYWCFKDDNGDSRSVSFKQINEGECGGWEALNPKEAKSLLPGKRIVELTDDRIHNPSKTNNPLVYKPLYPFLRKSENHPKGFCAPCCSQVPLEHDGFPNESDQVRNQKSKEQKLYFEHMYFPGNKKGSIVVDKTFENDAQIKAFIKQWEGLGPSFKITKQGNRVKIIDIGTNKDDPSKLNKADLIPKNKNTPDNPSREDIDKLLMKTKNTQRFHVCTNPDAKMPQTTPPKTKKTKPKKKSKTFTNRERETLRDTNEDLLDIDIDTDTDLSDPSKLKKTKKETKKQKKERKKRKTTAPKKIKPFLFEFPLKQPGSFGYLKPSLQKFIQYDTTSICYNNPPNDSSLKPNASCLLRLGVQKNPNQSFLENIAAIQNKTLSEFKSEIVNRITLSKFIVAFRGDLIELFYDKTKTVNKKTKQKIIKSINENIINDYVLMEKMGEKLVNAYINFIDYLKDDTISIDYSYLWDFVCKPMDKHNAGVVFETGVNLVIFNAPQDDITDKIEIICPKQTFTNEIFSEFKPTIMLYKEGVYFEPIVMFDNKNNTLTTTFDYETLISETMIHSLFTDIKDKMMKGCSLKPSIPDKYDYKRNISAKSLIERLMAINKVANAPKVSIVKQVVHYNYKTIGIVAKVNNTPIYVPCHPSHIIIDMDYEYFDSPNVLFDAITTFNTLSLLARKHNLPCLPIKILVVDKSTVTGYITETNQLVPTQPFDYDESLFMITDRNNKPISKAKSVIYIKENSEYFSDKDIVKQTTEDIERIMVIRNFLLEKNFYSCYRNIFKKEIGEEKNGNLRQQLIDMLDTTIKTKKSDTLKEYNAKYKQVEKIVNKIITKKVVDFVVYQSAMLNDLYRQIKQNINICVSNKKTIHLPIKNLIDKTNNKEKYSTKLIDELIRYPRLRDYMLYNKSTTTIDVVNYSVNDNEVIILEEEMFNNYLSNVTLEPKNKYINLNSHGFTKPIQTKSYKTTFNIDYEKYIEKDNKLAANKQSTANTIDMNIYQPRDASTPMVEVPKDVDEYVSNIVNDTVQKCIPTFNKNKNIISKLFNNYSLNENLKYHKIVAPRIEDTKGKVKENCTWNVIQEIYKDYYNTSITKMELCKTLVSILKRIHDDKTFVTKPGTVTDVPNYVQILKMTYRVKESREWSIIEEIEKSQWSHLFTIVSNKDFYITEFEVYLLCDYFKLPCIIHGTTEKKPSAISIYNKSSIKHYDPLYTTFNTSLLGKKVSKESMATIKNNLYTNRNNDKFCYVVGYVQFRLSDYYNKEGVKNNQGINRYYGNMYKLPFDVGLMKNADDMYKIIVNKEYIQQLIKHSVSPNPKQYIDMIFKPNKDTPSIYESFVKEMLMFKQIKQNKNKKFKIKT